MVSFRNSILVLVGALMLQPASAVTAKSHSFEVNCAHMCDDTTMIFNRDVCCNTRCKSENNDDKQHLSKGDRWYVVGSYFPWSNVDGKEKRILSNLIMDMGMREMLRDHYAKPSNNAKRGEDGDNAGSDSDSDNESDEDEEVEVDDPSLEKRKNRRVCYADSSWN